MKCELATQAEPIKLIMMSVSILQQTHSPNTGNELPGIRLRIGIDGPKQAAKLAIQ